MVQHVAPGDEYFTNEEFGAIEAAFRAAGSDVQTYRYPGTGHWFAERGSPGFDEPAFELARSRVIGDLRVAGRRGRRARPAAALGAQPEAPYVPA